MNDEGQRTKNAGLPVKRRPCVMAQRKLPQAVQNEIVWTHDKPLSHMYTFPLDRSEDNVNFPVTVRRGNGLCFTGFRKTSGRRVIDLNWSHSGREWKHNKRSLSRLVRHRLKWERRLDLGHHEQDFAAFEKFLNKSPSPSHLNRMYMTLVNWRALRSRRQLVNIQEADDIRRRGQSQDEDLTWFPVLMEMPDGAVIVMPFVSTAPEPAHGEALKIVDGNISDTIVSVRRVLPSGRLYGPTSHVYRSQLRTNIYAPEMTHAEYSIADVFARKIGSIVCLDERSVVSLPYYHPSPDTLMPRVDQMHMACEAVQGEEALLQLSKGFEASIIIWGLVGLEEVSIPPFMVSITEDGVFDGNTPVDEDGEVSPDMRQFIQFVLDAEHSSSPRTP